MRLIKTMRSFLKKYNKIFNKNNNNNSDQHWLVLKLKITKPHNVVCALYHVKRHLSKMLAAPNASVTPRASHHALGSGAICL